MEAPIRVLMITTGWPQPGQPQTTHFIKRQAEFLRAAGVHVDVFRFRGRRNVMSYVRAWFKVRPRLTRRRYDLVHAQWGQSGLMALPKRLPFVVTYRSGDLHGLVDRNGRQTVVGRLLQFLCRVVGRRADAIILVSEHMQRFLDPGTPVHVIPSGLDFDLFRVIPKAEARRHLGLPATKRLVLFAGDPASTRKRYDLAQEAMKLLNKSLPAELVVAWGAPHGDMPYFMSACDALVFTSRQEGSPNVVKEALACNLPVVSVAVGDVPLRLRGVDGCELCTDERPETIAAALERVLRRGQRCAGREAVQDLDERVTTERVIAIYRGVLTQDSDLGTRNSGLGVGAGSIKPEPESPGDSGLGTRNSGVDVGARSIKPRPESLTPSPESRV
jgi:teichuronic acid biosynthesis glycosyltransferase TuaC